MLPYIHDFFFIFRQNCIEQSSGRDSCVCISPYITDWITMLAVSTDLFTHRLTVILFIRCQERANESQCRTPVISFSVPYCRAFRGVSGGGVLDGLPEIKRGSPPPLPSNLSGSCSFDHCENPRRQLTVTYGVLFSESCNSKPNLDCN